MPGNALLAVFVGGQSRRMGTPKGLLLTPGSSEPILEAIVRHGRDAGLHLALVGEATPYAGLARGVLRIADDPPAAGPLGGLNAALGHAIHHGHPNVIAVACDMPHLSASVLDSLANHVSEAPILAPRRDRTAPWEPLLARYDADQVAPVLRDSIAAGVRSFQTLFSSLEVEALPLTRELERALDDWDTPDDLRR